MYNCIAITGCGGFVAPFLARQLRSSQPNTKIIGTALEAEIVSKDFDTVVRLDVCDEGAVKAFFADQSPEAIYHLAALSRPASEVADAYFLVNTLGTLHVVSAALASGCAVLAVSSGYVYGGGPSPFQENEPAKPTNHYAASKYAGELAALVAARSGGRMVIARPFNHTGPGQSDDFFVGSVVRQAAQLERAGKGGSIKVGNRSTIRDYTDVRDVVRAYELLLETGQSGAVYNVASARGATIDQILSIVVRLVQGSTIDIVDEQDRQRPADLACLVGDPSRLMQLGWSPAISLERTIADMLDHERRCGASPE